MGFGSFLRRGVNPLPPAAAVGAARGGTAPLLQNAHGGRLSQLAPAPGAAPAPAPKPGINMGALGMAISNLGSMLPARTPAIQGSWGALMDQAKSAGLKAGADRAGVAPQPEAITNAAPAAPPMRGARRRAPSFGGGMGF